jgi:hypothetical protein
MNNRIYRVYFHYKDSCHCEYFWRFAASSAKSAKQKAMRHFENQIVILQAVLD